MILDYVAVLTLALIVAFIIWINIVAIRRRAAMTPAQRSEEDGRVDDDSAIW